jgi:hypothetical protein
MGWRGGMGGWWVDEGEGMWIRGGPTPVTQLVPTMVGGVGRVGRVVGVGRPRGAVVVVAVVVVVVRGRRAVRV